jgi:hypothetical protein
MNRLLDLPIQAKMIIAAGLAALLMFAGFRMNGYIKDAEIAKLNEAHTEVLRVATAARLTAEMKSRDDESKAVVAIAAASDQFEEVRQNEKAITDRRINDLLVDNSRLYVSTRAANRRSVPGAPATTVASDGEADQTLAPAVAGRLASRYAAYNEVVDQLTLCQDTITTYRNMK